MVTRKRGKRSSKRTAKKSPAMEFLDDLIGEPMSLGGLINAIRLGEELNQVEFAKQLGISKAHLCDIEKGRRTVSPERSARFAKILGYSERQFVRLSLQAILDQAGIKMNVNVEAA